MLIGVIGVIPILVMKLAVDIDANLRHDLDLG